MMKMSPTVNRLPTARARLFVAHGGLSALAMSQMTRPLPVPEVTYVDWSEWERAAAAFASSRVDAQSAIAPAQR